MELRTVLAALQNQDGTETWVVQEPDGSLSHEQRHPDKPATVTALPLSPDLDAVRELLYLDSATPEDKAAVFPVVESLRKGERVKAADMEAVAGKLQAAYDAEIAAAKDASFGESGTAYV